MKKQIIVCDRCSKDISEAYACVYTDLTQFDLVDKEGKRIEKIELCLDCYNLLRLCIADIILNTEVENE